MNYIAKHKVENGDRVDDIEDHSTFVKQELGPAMLVRVRNKPDQISVDYTAEEDMKSDS